MRNFVWCAELWPTSVLLLRQLCHAMQGQLGVGRAVAGDEKSATLDSDERHAFQTLAEHGWEKEKGKRPPPTQDTHTDTHHST